MSLPISLEFHLDICLQRKASAQSSGSRAAPRGTMTPRGASTTARGAQGARTTSRGAATAGQVLMFYNSNVKILVAYFT